MWLHDDVIKWKYFPRYWPFVREIHRSPVNSPHKGQWRGALMFSLICVSINGWVNNLEAADLRRHRVHYYVTVMSYEMKCDWPGSSGFENRELSLCQLCCYWWHYWLSLWQPVVLTMATKLPLWQLSVFSVSPSYCTISHRNAIARNISWDLVNHFETTAKISKWSMKRTRSISLPTKERLKK